MSASERTISLPFSFDSFRAVTSTTSQEKIWADRVRSSVATTLYERVMRPAYGTSIASQVFTNSDDSRQRINDDVVDVFIRQLPLLTLDSVIIDFEEETASLRLEIIYQLPSRVQSSVIIGIVQISPDSPLIEERL
jgi:phage baseplate assembly protein W